MDALRRTAGLTSPTMAPSSILGRLTRALSSASRTTTLIILAAATIMGMTAAISGFGLGAERQAQMWRDTIRSRPATGKLVLVEIDEIGRAHVCTPVTNAHLVCRLL